MKEIQLKISAKIKTAREDAKIYQQELGKLLRLSRSAYIKIEQGQTAITVTRLLEMNKNSTLSEVSAIVQVSILTLQKWRKAYLTQGICFLEEKNRSGRPTSFGGTVRAQITSLACSDAPEGYSRWSLRLLADKLVELDIVEDISYETVGVILKKTNFAPT